MRLLSQRGELLRVHARHREVVPRLSARALSLQRGATWLHWAALWL